MGQDESPNTPCQTSNLFPIPSWMMKEILCLPTICYMLQNLLYVLTMHPLPPQPYELTSLW